MIDAHCHLNFYKFANDYDEVIKNAATAGVRIIINAGTQVSSSQWAVDLSRKYTNLYAIIGVHPHHADKLKYQQPNWMDELEALAKCPKVIGIGEIGMDYFPYKSNGIVDPKIQREIFKQQLELAGKLKLPLQVHSRTEKARLEIIHILKSNQNLLQDPPGMFHCIAGTQETLKKIVDLGFFVGFDGNVTYEGLPPGEPATLRELLKYAPLDRIIIETDSPYLTPLPIRNLRNEPKYAIMIAEFIAGLKSVTLEKVMEQTDKNVCIVFNKLRTCQ